MAHRPTGPPAHRLTGPPAHLRPTSPPDDGRWREHPSAKAVAVRPTRPTHGPRPCPMGKCNISTPLPYPSMTHTCDVSVTCQQNGAPVRQGPGESCPPCDTPGSGSVPSTTKCERTCDISSGSVGARLIHETSSVTPMRQECACGNTRVLRRGARGNTHVTPSDPSKRSRSHSVRPDGRYSGRRSSRRQADGAAREIKELWNEHSMKLRKECVRSTSRTTRGHGRCWRSCWCWC